MNVARRSTPSFIDRTCKPGPERANCALEGMITASHLCARRLTDRQ
jgi:hypothetical protein